MYQTKQIQVIFMCNGKGPCKYTIKVNGKDNHSNVNLTPYSMFTLNIDVSQLKTEPAQ